MKEELYDQIGNILGENRISKISHVRKQAEKIMAGVATGSAIVGAGAKGVTEINRLRVGSILRDVQQDYGSVCKQYAQEVKITKQVIDKVILSKKLILSKDVTGFVNVYKKLHENTIVVVPTSGMENLTEYTYNSDDISRWEITIDIYNDCYLSEEGYRIGYSLIQEGVVDELFESVSKYTDAIKRNNITVVNEAKEELRECKTQILSQACPVIVEIAQGLLKEAINSSHYVNEAKADKLQLEREIERKKIELEGVKAIKQWAFVQQITLNRMKCLADEYTDKTIAIIKSKRKPLFKKISKDQFTNSELQIIAFTAALIKACMSVIRLPILSKQGDVYTDKENIIEKLDSDIKEFNQCSKKIRDSL